MIGINISKSAIKMLKIKRRSDTYNIDQNLRNLKTFLVITELLLLRLIMKLLYCEVCKDI